MRRTPQNHIYPGNRHHMFSCSTRPIRPHDTVSLTGGASKPVASVPVGVGVAADLSAPAPTSMITTHLAGLRPLRVDGQHYHRPEPAPTRSISAPSIFVSPAPTSTFYRYRSSTSGRSVRFRQVEGD